jgi:hypothetical protein
MSLHFLHFKAKKNLLTLWKSFEINLIKRDVSTKTSIDGSGNFPSKKELQTYTSLDEHDPEVISLFIGCLLGDASAKRERILGNGEKKLKNTLISFGQGQKNIKYIQHIKDFLSKRNYTNTLPLKTNMRFDKRTNKNYSSIKFDTYSFKSLNDLHALFYRPVTEQETVKGKGRRFIKKIPQNIAEFLNVKVLAYCKALYG